MAEVGQSVVLKPEEEAELARKARAGDRQARERLITSNTRFVISVAKQYQSYGIPLEDLISAGNEGLIIAVDRFDESRGFKFISYGVWWIRQSIYQYLYSHSRIVKIPQNIEQSIIKARNFIEHRYTQTGERISLQDAIEEMGLRGGKYISEGIGRGESLSKPINCIDDNLTFEDVLQDDSLPPDCPKEENDRLVMFVKRVLSERDAEIVLMHFGIGYPQSFCTYDIGKKTGLSGERIRQIIQNAITRLRKRAEICNISLS